MLATLLVLLLTGSPSYALPAPACTRDLLHHHTQSYLLAQTAGNPLLLLGTTAAPVSYTEDFLIITDPTNPRVIGTQIRFDPSESTIQKIETLVTKEGDWAFNASLTYFYANRETENNLWFTIPESERDSRAVIQAAADAYLDLFNDPSLLVPWGTPCNRLEGSWYTGDFIATDSCNVGVPTPQTTCLKWEGISLGTISTQKNYSHTHTVWFYIYSMQPHPHLEQAIPYTVHTLV
ncbi:hypothetical protein QBC44DRAFT_342637 [Cladorrhinum sp. PSN332]|nr:hypothetical protein QBC44DRAFT_342637 [Cladorrhinum sp. PSN332]